MIRFSFRVAFNISIMKIFSNFGVLMFIGLNIALPTVDISTDMYMIYKLFHGAWGCVNPERWSEDFQTWQECLIDPESFCNDNTTTQHSEICTRVTTGILGWSCVDPKNWSSDYQDWFKCRSGADVFCSNQTTEVDICQYQSHPKFGFSMMVPYLINYLICFLTWHRLDLTKKKSFLFPLLNTYTQLGEKNK